MELAGAGRELIYKFGAIWIVAHAELTEELSKSKVQRKRCCFVFFLKKKEATTEIILNVTTIVSIEIDMRDYVQHVNTPTHCDLWSSQRWFNIVVLQGFSKIEFMCFLKKQKHEKISRGVFTNIPAVHSIVSIVRHVHVLFYNNREIAAVWSVRSDGPVWIYFGSIPLDWKRLDSELG